MLPLPDVDAVGAHVFRDGKRSGEFGELGRLHSQRSEHEPRARTLDFVGIEDGGKQNHEQNAVDEPRGSVVDAVVEQQNDESEHQTCANPDDLHSRARRSAENVGFAVGIGRAADADPSKNEQCHVDCDGQPVERPQYRRIFICLSYHSEFVCSGTPQPSTRSQATAFR